MEISTKSLPEHPKKYIIVTVTNRSDGVGDATLMFKLMNEIQKNVPNKEYQVIGILNLESGHFRYESKSIRNKILKRISVMNDSCKLLINSEEIPLEAVNDMNKKLQKDSENETLTNYYEFQNELNKLKKKKPAFNNQKEMYNAFKNTKVILDIRSLSVEKFEPTYKRLVKQVKSKLDPSTIIISCEELGKSHEALLKANSSDIEPYDLHADFGLPEIITIEKHGEKKQITNTRPLGVLLSPDLQKEKLKLDDRISLALMLKDKKFIKALFNIDKIPSEEEYKKLLENYFNNTSLSLGYLQSKESGTLFFMSQILKNVEDEKVIKNCDFHINRGAFNTAMLVNYGKHFNVKDCEIQIITLDDKKKIKKEIYKIGQGTHKVRFFCGFFLDDHDYDILRKMANGLKACSGDNSFSEVISTYGLPFFGYRDKNQFSKNFVKNNLLNYLKSHKLHSQNFPNLIKYIETTIAALHSKHKTLSPRYIRNLSKCLKNPELQAEWDVFRKIIIKELNYNANFLEKLDEALKLSAHQTKKYTKPSF